MSESESFCKERVWHLFRRSSEIGLLCGRCEEPCAYCSISSTCSGNLGPDLLLTNRLTLGREKKVTGSKVLLASLENLGDLYDCAQLG